MQLPKLLAKAFKAFSGINKVEGARNATADKPSIVNAKIVDGLLIVDSAAWTGGRPAPKPPTTKRRPF